MFTIYLLDIYKYELSDKIEGFNGNERILVPTDRNKYPILSSLSFCEEDVFARDLLPELEHEFHVLHQKFIKNMIISSYLERIIILVQKAIQQKKRVLITPFTE